MLAQIQSQVDFLKEENALLRQRLFGRKSKQIDGATPQLALFNEVKSVVQPVDETSDEEVVAPTKRRGECKQLPADLPPTRNFPSMN
jgi:transposase